MSAVSRRSLSLLLVIVSFGSVHGQVHIFRTSPIARPGTDTLAVWNKGAAPTVVQVPIPAGTTPRQKRNLIVAALQKKAVAATKGTGNRFHIKAAKRVTWLSNTGENRDTAQSQLPSSAAMTYEGQPQGFDPQGNPATYTAGFTVPGFSTEVMLTPNDFDPFRTPVSMALFQQLQWQIPPHMQPMLNLRPAAQHHPVRFHGPPQSQLRALRVRLGQY